MSTTDTKKTREEFDTFLSTNPIAALNMTILVTALQIAEEENGSHELAIKFGFSRETSSALTRLSTVALMNIVRSLGSTVLMAGKNYDQNLYQLMRAEIKSDLSTLARLRNVASMKTDFSNQLNME